MSISTALSIISSSLSANAAQSAVVSSNVANANTPGYAREMANQVTNSYGGADVVSVTRQANAALQEQATAASSQAATQQTISAGLAQLAATVDDSASTTSTSGATQNGGSPSAMLANLQTALSLYANAPNQAALGSAVVTAAGNLTASLNGASATVQQVRQQADQAMETSVKTINGLLAQFATANTAVVSGLNTGANISSAQDTRNSIVSQLAQQLGVTTTVAANGSMSIYTDSGVTLFQDQPRTVTFTPSPTLVGGQSGNAVVVGGVPITGAGSPMPVQSGALAGDAALRDSLAPQYQAQLDQIANGLISAFAESDQSAAPTQPTLPGLFTTVGAAAMPATTVGLAAAITVNPNVDPAQGGNVTLLRDGGISAPGNPAYVYNATGAASFSSRLQQLAGGLGATQAFNPGAGLGAASNLTDYANASVSWLQSKSSQASNASDYQNALLTQATAALSNATGVNLDAEMANMLNLENAYSASAKLLTTVNAMFTALLQAA